MDDKDEGANPGEVAGPAEGHQGNGGDVVDKHLPEVLTLHIIKLRKAQGPVETQLYHVVHPHLKKCIIIIRSKRNSNGTIKELICKQEPTFTTINFYLAKHSSVKHTKLEKLNKCMNFG